MNVKFKCPFCGQEYDLTGEQVLEFRHQKMQCAAPGCEQKFYLAETIPCLGHAEGRGFEASGLVALIEAELELERCKKELADEKEKLKTFKPENKYDYFDDERFDRSSCESNIESLKNDISVMKEELKEEKEAYAQSKKNLPTKKKAEDEVYRQIGEAFCEEEVKVPPSPEDIDKLIRIFRCGNEYDGGFELTLQRYGMEYCLA